jgi:UPF0176 protein
MTDDAPVAMVVATFYKFTPLRDLRGLRQDLLAYGGTRDLKGSVLLAPEGLNGYVSGEPQTVQAFIDYLQGTPQIGPLEIKTTETGAHAFGRFKVRVKREIVTIGLSTDPTARVGRYVEADEWNRLLADPEVLVVDVRNRYEIAEGTFPGAVDPRTDSFRQFPEWVERELDPLRHRRVAMFCTGGIRCEKATSYLLSRGFEDVVHLHGGIVRYLQTVEPEESRWEGRCYVFDESGSI